MVLVVWVFFGHYIGYIERKVELVIYLVMLFCMLQMDIRLVIYGWTYIYDQLFNCSVLAVESQEASGIL